MQPKDLQENSLRASRLLRAMSNEKRLMILCNLLGGEISVQQIQKATGLSQSTVSQQLAILRAEKLVTNRRQAQSVLYGINSHEAEQILETLYRIFCSAEPQTAAPQETAAPQG
jgi:ArsR family transcriptional regulator, virulence genes transcriptional regulator